MANGYGSQQNTAGNEPLKTGGSIGHNRKKNFKRSHFQTFLRNYLGTKVSRSFGTKIERK
jgi:hypothetical protein